MSTRDDDAFRWEGDDDPAAGQPSDAPTSPLGDEQDVDPDMSVVSDDDASEATGAEPDEATGIGSVALVAYGVLGGLYALWTVGWILGAARLRSWIEQATSTVADVMFQASMVLAVAAPAVWFVTVLAATRGKRTWLRFLWLAFGAVLLVPWPFVMVGVIGQ